jgi:hypothetical protein
VGGGNYRIKRRYVCLEIRFLSLAEPGEEGLLIYTREKKVRPTAKSKRVSNGEDTYTYSIGEKINRAGIK